MQITVRIARVFLASRQGVLCAHRFDRNCGEIGAICEARIERKLNLLPIGDVAVRLAALIKHGALEVAEMPDGVGWPIGALKPQSWLTRLRQTHPSRKDQVKDNCSARFRFTPDAEVLIELLVQPLRTRSCSNCQANRARRPHICRAPYLAPEAFLENTSDRRKLRSSSRDIQRIEFSVGMSRKQLFHDLSGRFDKRPTTLVVEIRRKCHLLPLRAYPLQIDADLACIRAERFLFLAALIQQHAVL